MESLDAIESAIDVRQVGINLNHWYVIAQCQELKTQPIERVLWHQAIVLYRDSEGKIQALENRCPHRQVKLSDGKVYGNEIECAYHGWRFDGNGHCTSVPYLEERQKLPTCPIRRYPVREQDGLIWLFPGHSRLADTIPLMGVPEWEHLNYIGSIAVIDCQAHFSFLMENLMDMYHGHLHNAYQAWANPKLTDLQATSDWVKAEYDAQSYYKIDKIWSVSQLFIPALRQLHPEPLTVCYRYPHWVSTLGQDFKIYCLLNPISQTQTRAYLVHFTSLNAFKRLHKLPISFRRWVKTLCTGTAKGMLEGLIRQDVQMMEQEQQAYLQAPQRRGYELNRTLGSVQRLIRQQFQQFCQE